MAALRGSDYFMVAADFDSYFEAQRAIGRHWRGGSAWWRSAILNTANMAWFSSDRTIHEYAKDIWRIQPVPVPSEGGAR